MTTKNVFISHVSEDEYSLPLVKDLLSKSGYSIRNGSIDSTKPNNAHDPDYIKDQILKPRIDWAGVTIVLISPNTHKSEWVNWEIEYSASQEKPIVGVWLPGARGSDLPDQFEQSADALVAWNAEKIIEAIEGRLENWETPDGEECKPREISRIVCQ